MKKIGSGKVREIYEVSDKELVIYTTDRVSAFDVILPTPVPEKGRVLNQLSLFWFDLTKDIVKNHLVSARPQGYAGGIFQRGIQRPCDAGEEAENAALRVHHPGLHVRLHVEGLPGRRALLRPGYHRRLPAGPKAGKAHPHPLHQGHRGPR